MVFTADQSPSPFLPPSPLSSLAFPSLSTNQRQEYIDRLERILYTNIRPWWLGNSVVDLENGMREKGGREGGRAEGRREGATQHHPNTKAEEWRGIPALYLIWTHVHTYIYDQEVSTSTMTSMGTTLALLPK